MNTKEAKRYDLVVAFGDTDITDRSRARARLAAEHRASTYLLVGTQREQDSMLDEMVSTAGRLRSPQFGRIMTSTPSIHTKANILIMGAVAATIAYPRGAMGEGEAKASVLVVSHDVHAERIFELLRKQPIPHIEVEYQTIPERSWRRIVEHKVLKAMDAILPWESGAVETVSAARERIKGRVER